MSHFSSEPLTTDFQNLRLSQGSRPARPLHLKSEFQQACKMLNIKEISVDGIKFHDDSEEEEPPVNVNPQCDYRSNDPKEVEQGSGRRPNDASSNPRSELRSRVVGPRARGGSKSKSKSKSKSSRSSSSSRRTSFAQQKLARLGQLSTETSSTINQISASLPALLQFEQDLAAKIASVSDLATDVDEGIQSDEDGDSDMF